MSQTLSRGRLMPGPGFRIAVALAALWLAAAPLPAQTVVEEWAGAKIPPPPVLKPAKVEAREAVLLVMDFTTQTCSAQRRPRCVASVPKIAKLIGAARAKGALVVYSIAGQGATPASILPELAPAVGETVLPALGPDKFIGSDLEQQLKARAIKTVVAVGTQAQTSVLHTAGAAALRGFNVVVPVDGMSSDDVFPELYTAWHLSTAARIADKTTLTKIDLVEF